MFLTLCIVIGHLVQQYACNNHLILEPQSDNYGPSTEDVVFIIFPQVEVPATAYISLCNIIQKVSRLKLWVGIVDSKSGTHYEVDDVQQIVNGVIKDVYSLRKSGGDIDVILGGHGQSGTLLQHFVSEQPNSVRGIVLMGTQMLSDRRLLEMNVPILTVAGNIDGVTKVTTLAKVYENYMKQVAITPSLKYRFPMVIIDGVNHGIFSNGRLPIYLASQDIKSDQDENKLRQDIAQPIALFLMYCKDSHNRNVIDHLNSYLADTREMLEPLIKAHEITSSDFQSYWVKQSQMWLSELIGKQSTKINVESYFTYQSAFDPAHFNDSPLKITIYLFSQLDTPIETRNLLTNEMPSQIHARMFRRDKILQMLGMSRNNTAERTCKDLNYASYLMAYYTSPKQVRDRFDKRNPGIQFHDDILISSEESWNEHNLIVTKENNILHVTSYAYITDNVSDTGHIFCTLLPPIRAMEWIYYGIHK